MVLRGQRTANGRVYRSTEEGPLGQFMGSLSREYSPNFNWSNEGGCENLTKRGGGADSTGATRRI